MFDLLPEILPNILGIIANGSRLSEMVKVKLYITSGSIAIENILSRRVLQ